MSTAAALDTDVERRRARARELLTSAFVVHLAELPRSPVHPDRLLTDPLELTTELIDEWQTAHLDVVGCVTFSRQQDPHAGLLDQLSRWNSVIAEHGDRLLRIDDAADLALARSTGRLGILISAHLGEMFREVDDVNLFHKLGLRNAMIVNDAQNKIGSAPQDRRDTGLSLFGAAVVERMATVGMAVDLSHVSERTAQDVLDIATGPVLLSHTNAHALCPNLKNKSDEVLRRVAEGGGTVGVAAVRPVVSGGADVTLEHLLDHFDHLSALLGPEHVALGFESPLQGYDSLPPENTPRWPVWVPPGSRLDVDGFAGPDRLVDLVEGLMRRGRTDDEIAGILGGNVGRTLGAITAGVAAAPTSGSPHAGRAHADDDKDTS